MVSCYMMLHAFLGNQVLETACRLGVEDLGWVPAPRCEVSPATYPYQISQLYSAAGSTHSLKLIPSRMQKSRLIRFGSFLMRAWLAGIMLAIFGLWLAVI